MNLGTARIYDIEMFLVGFYYLDVDVKTGEYREFEISERKNDLYSFVKYIRDGGIDWMIGFNNVNYDMQIVQFIVDRHEQWHLMSASEIVAVIYAFSQKVIDDRNYGLFAPYWESQFCVKQIDLFKIHHFDNESRMTSLKWLQYMMNWWNLETIPHPHDRKITWEQWDEVIRYCKNDVNSTKQFYLYTIGEVEHEFYKGKNKIQDRLDLIEEGLLGWEAINYSDSKIGDELNKRAYSKLIKKPIEYLYELKRNRKPTKKFTFGDAIPEYVKFSTPELQSFYNSIKNVRVKLNNEEQDSPVTFRGTSYVIARGGIHSTESCRIIIPKEDELLYDADVQSQYPNAIRKRKLFPKHLGIEWNMVGVQNINTRLLYKAKSEDTSLPDDERRKYKGLSDMYKLALNSGLKK